MSVYGRTPEEQALAAEEMGHYRWSGTNRKLILGDVGFGKKSKRAIIRLVPKQHPSFGRVYDVKILQWVKPPLRKWRWKTVATLTNARSAQIAVREARNIAQKHRLEIVEGPTMEDAFAMDEASKSAVSGPVFTKLLALGRV